jgi:tetratricopeptide (TPR) repeat protein
MSGVISTWIDPEDLSVRARRGPLSEIEQQALERALESSQALAVAYRVGMDLDRIGIVHPGDDELIARMADVTLSASLEPHRRSPLRRNVMLGLAAALTLAGSAAAWRGVTNWRAPLKPIALSVVAPKPLPTSRLPSAPSAAAQALAVPAIVIPEQKVGAMTNGSKSDAVQVIPARTQSAVGAATLLRDASAARRAGDFERARSLFLQLESDFPASLEAQLAHVSLGKVLLSVGRAKEAEQQFASYLKSGGTLTEEAMVGRAQCLARLGRAIDEQRVWETLLRDFPSSVYKGEAKKRLLALDTVQP